MRARDAASCGSHEKTLTEVSYESYAFEAEKNLYVTPPPLVQGVCTTVCV